MSKQFNKTIKIVRKRIGSEWIGRAPITSALGSTPGARRSAEVLFVARVAPITDARTGSLTSLPEELMVFHQPDDSVYRFIEFVQFIWRPDF